jgi:transcription termination factor Rho
MTVLERRALEDSPLADLHAIAAELSLDGYRRLRREDLIDAILSRQGAPAAAGAAASGGEDGDEEGRRGPGREEGGARRRRGRRGGRGREDREEREVDGGREGRGSRDGREGRDGRETRDGRDREGRNCGPERAAPEEIVEGVVELLANGSGFVRVAPPDPSDDDVYISAAQVKRCELIPGDRLSGPRRAPQRSERFASLVRIDTINGVPADQAADRTRFDELPTEFPRERFRLGEGDPTLSAVEFLAPFGRGSRVLVTGGRWAGKSHVVRRLAAVLAADESLTVLAVLAGVRPEETPDWEIDRVSLSASVPLGGSPDAQGHAVELAVDQARRLAARGAHAVVIIDGLDGLPPAVARKALAAARALREGGSLTVIAAGSTPVGGETTVIALDAELAMTGRHPALDLRASGTLRAERLIGEAGAAAIVQARREALGLSGD